MIVIRKLNCTNSLMNYRYLSTNNSKFRKSNPTYYDILNVKQDCDTKEIRNSFLKLSKKYHPDVKGKNNDTKNMENYLKIMEAYQTLSKVDSRRLYDISLENPGELSANVYHRRSNDESWKIKPNYSPNPGSYYGVKGLNKVSNFKILGVILLIVTVGTIFEFYLVRDALDERSRKIGLQHADVRAVAEKRGNEKQIENLNDRFVSTRY